MLPISVRVAVALAVVLAVASASAREHRPGAAHAMGPPVVLERPKRVEKQLDELVERVAALKAIADMSLRGDAQKRALAELQALRAIAVDLREQVRAARPLPPTTLVQEVVVEPPPPEPVGPTPMAEADFGQALGAIDAESFSDGKLRVIEDFAGHGWFLVDQVKRVIEALTYGKDRVRALELLAPRILDRENQFKIYDAFTYDSEKAEARKILAR